MLFPDEPPASPLVGIARLASEGETLESKSRATYRELPTRRWLNRCDSRRVPFDWTINPYRGCEYGCRYCYARYTHEFLELRAPEAFETDIFAKRWNAAGFANELRGVQAGESIAIGTATDPYQPAERRYGLTRKVLAALARERGRTVYVTTKSDLVARDADLLREVSNGNRLAVTVTVTTMDRSLARLLEPMAPRPDLRIGAVRRLADAGVPVGVMASPILPLLTDSKESLEAVAAAAAEAGSSFFVAQVLFLKPCARQVMFPFLERQFPHLLQRYVARYARRAYLDGEYPVRMRERVRAIRAQFGLEARLAELPTAAEAPSQLRLY